MLLTRRKYNRGRVIEKQQSFGGIERAANKCFVVPVEQQDAVTLLPLIGQYVVLGTTAVSNQWTAYSTIKNMPEEYQHETINYSLHLIDPETGAYTSSIKSLWQKFKEGHKSRCGTERGPLNSYMDELVWKKIYEDNTLYHLWFQIAKQYPPLPGSV